MRKQARMEPLFNWREIPFVRLLLPFLLGLGIALFTSFHFPYTEFVLIFLFFSMAFFTFSSIRFQQRWLFGMLLHLFFLGWGYHLGHDHHEFQDSQHFQKYLEKENWIIAQVTSTPTPGKKLSITGKIIAISSSQQADQWNTCSGNILMYLEPNLEHTKVNYGDQLLLQARINPIAAPKNPVAFNYQNYQHFKNTHYQLFAKADHWKITNTNCGNPLLQQAFALRQHFMSVLKKHLPQEAEYGVAAALILGNRSAITAEVREAYSSTGATHVLAVSGLHVGFIYLGLAGLLQLFRLRGKTWRIIKTLMLIGAVWGFAFLTGASPSVLRAATMFSFIIVGRTLNRSTNIYNTLAISAFFLLCFNPYFLADIGFQLSYLAVFGIVSFQAWFYRCWIIDHPVGDYIWKLMSVSLAAQLITFPITLFYFHQFPFYFWLSGLVVVPTAMLVLGGGLLLFFLESFVPVLAGLIGVVLNGVIWMMNALIYLIQQLPMALIQGLWIGIGGMILLYLILIVLSLLFRENKNYRLLAIVAALNLIFAAIAWQSYQRYDQKEVVVYQVSKNSLVDVVDGRRIYSFQSEDLTDKAINFAAQNYRWQLGMQTQKKYSFDQEKIQGEHWYFQKGLLQFHQKRLAFFDPKNLPVHSQLFPLDYLLLRNTPSIDIPQLHQNHPNAIWIADASNNPWTVTKWQQQCKQLQIPFINGIEQGAQVISIGK